MARPDVRRAQRWNIVWVVPLIALLLGIWLLYRNFATQGPVATIHFETAEEITAMKTEVRCRSVKVGTVKKVSLTNDLDSVVVTVELEPGLGDLLRDGTRFWVVKPRVSAAEVSGLGTLIQGAYIELDPGSSDARHLYTFQGLEKPPATNSSVPGLRVSLTADQASRLEVGAPVHHRGFAVGRIEERKLAEDGGSVTYNAFIAQEYRHLVTTNTRFWNTTGIEVDTSPQGVSLHTPSLQAIVSGGVSFGVPTGLKPGPPSEDGVTYALFSNKEVANFPKLNPTQRFLLLFDQSVRGLTTRSAVEFRGIPIGRICQISTHLADLPGDRRIPVLIEVDPTRIITSKHAPTQQEAMNFFIQEAANGLRAGLKTTSLITSAVHIDFDYFPKSETATLGNVGEHITFPTITSGFSHIEVQISALLEKLQKLEIETAINSLAGAADESKAMATSLRKLLDDPAFEGLPADFKATLKNLDTAVSSIGPDGDMQDEIQGTLAELREALQSIKAVADLLEEKPNSLIFGRGKDKDGDKTEDENSPPNRPHPPHRR